MLLDNAADSAQIRPLIPVSAGSMIVVTSRNQLADLVTVDSAYPVPIGPCTPAEGRELLAAQLGAAQLGAAQLGAARLGAARLGAAWLEREIEPAEEIVEICAGMPLALSVVAAHPGFTLAALVADLQNAGGAALTADVRPTMTWSYAALSDPAAQAFRILGLHPHAEVTADLVAAVDGLGPDEARARHRRSGTPGTLSPF